MLFLLEVFRTVLLHVLSRIRHLCAAIHVMPLEQRSEEQRVWCLAREYEIWRILNPDSPKSVQDVSALTELRKTRVTNLNSRHALRLRHIVISSSAPPST